MYNDTKEHIGSLITLAVFALFFIGMGVSVLTFDPQQHYNEWFAHFDAVQPKHITLK